MRILGTAVLLLLLATTPAPASQLAVSSYTHTGADGGLYADSTGVELTDGVDANIAWGPGIPIGVSDIQPLVGWLLTNPTIEFHFSAPVTVGSVEVWLADSDGSAGVAMPSSITLSTTGGYSQTFPVIDPVGFGATIPVTIGGLNITSDNITITAAATQSWTMLSEVRFFTPIPEPTSLALTVWVLLPLLRRRKT